MKCVVGVDLEKRSHTVIRLLASLQFDISETLLLHLTESKDISVEWDVNGLYLEQDAAYGTILESTKRALESAEILANKLNLHPKTMWADGFPSTSLPNLAQQKGASLIAVTSMVTGPVDALINESTARQLALTARQSVLVARKETQVKGPIRAVFATDLSPYCDECAKILAEFRPQGISHLTLLTVQERVRHEKHAVGSGIENSSIDHDATRRLMIRKGDETAKWLTHNGIPTESRFESGNVNEVIRQVMLSSKADILILGASGHNFVQRLLLGSNALHEVVGEHYPVLLLRPAHHQTQSSTRLKG